MLSATLLASALGVFVFLFIFWKRLKEDYAGEIIFRCAFYILVGLLVGFFISNQFFPRWFFWTETAGMLAGLGLSIFTLKMRFYETLEAMVVGALPWLGFFFLKDSVVHSGLTSFFAFLLILVLVFISYWMDTHYKNFAWYKSGKIGFVGLTTLGIVFLLRAAIALTGLPVLSFVGKFEGVASASIAFICFLLLYNLGRQGIE